MKLPFSHLLLTTAALLGVVAHTVAAIEEKAESKITKYRYKSGDEMLSAFKPIGAALRHSIVKLDVNGSTTALATVIDTNGFAITKASELKKGKLTSWLAGGKEVSAELLATDERSDLALVQIHAQGLVPVEWSTRGVTVGQWTVTPGTEEVPQAAGIISVPARKILPKRAYLGITQSIDDQEARISFVFPGLGADLAGLKTNDIILAVNETQVKKHDDLVEALREFREGETVNIRIQRGDEKMNVPVTLVAEKAMPGRGFDRQAYMNRMGGDVSKRAEDFSAAIQHDTVLEPWLCGGPLVDLDKKVVGINIARAGRVATYALPTDLAREAIVRLRAQAVKQDGEKVKQDVDGSR